MSLESASAHYSEQALFDLVDRLEDNASQAAVICMDESGQRIMQRGRLAEQAKQLAAGLVEHGLGRGDRVVLCGPASIDWMLITLAALRSGATVVPVDGLMETDNFLHVLKDCRPKAVFTDEDHLRVIEESHLEQQPFIYLLDRSEHPSSWQTLSRGTAPSWPKVQANQEAVLFYTSGTTGAPKGVPISQANLSFQIETILKAELVSAGERILLPLPLHHVYPFVFGLLAPLAMKAAVILPQALTGPQILRAMQEGQAEAMIGVPRLYRVFYEGLHARIRSRSAFAERMLNSLEQICMALQNRFKISCGPWLLRPIHRQLGGHLRLMASGGAALDGDLARRLEGIGWQVMIGYGLTETSPLLTLRKPGFGPPESVGRPIPGVELTIDVQAGPEQTSLVDQDQPQESGEILARGPGVFHGYHNLPEETSRAFTEDGWFRTGDLGYVDQDGYLYVTGRASTLIVTDSGENIQPDHIERVIARHPLIAEIGVLSWNGKLVAVAVPDTENLAEAGEENQHRAMQRAIEEASSNLPSYMHLTDVQMSREPLARTRLGKIRRHLLQKRYEQADNQQERTDRQPLPFKDMSDQDKAVLEHQAAHRVWDWLSGRFPKQGLSPDTHLERDLGVDSMEWLTLTLTIHEQTGAELTEKAIDQIKTVRDLLSAVVDASKDAGAAADPVKDPWQALSQEQQAWLAPRSPIQRAIAWAVYWAGSAVLRLFYRVRIEGKNNLSCRGACLLAPNHASYLDPIVLAYALGPRNLSHTCWAGLSTVAFNNPFKRFICRLGQAVPITPEHGAVSGLAFASAILKRDQRLVWFPEGQRSPDGTLQPFKQGLGIVVKKIPVPIIPVWIEGTYAAWPASRRFPRPGSIRVIFGEPVNADELMDASSSDRPERDIMEGLQRRLAELGSDAS